MKKIVVLISGSGSNLEAIINACEEKKIYGQVVYVVSNNPNAYGLERAKRFNIDTKIIDHKLFFNRDDFDNNLQDFLDKLSPDLIILAGFMRILGRAVTDKYSTKMINLHPSLLPLYPGLDTHSQVLSNNDDNHGVSIHYVSAELDGGPLIAQGTIKVKNNEDENDLIDRIHKVEHLLLPEIVNEICIGNINLDRGKVVYKNIKSLDRGLIRKHYEI
tara:strand:- start:2726 stop:3376 length:651 start_codon:yes stop_codon:yes gene_type:complete